MDELEEELEIESQEDLDYDPNEGIINAPFDEELEVIRPRETKKLNKKIDEKTFFQTQVTKLLRIKKTQIEMIRDRGYDIGLDKEYLDMSYTQFYDKFKDFSIQELFSSLSKIYYNEQGQTTSVFYSIPTNKHLSATDIMPIFESIEKNSNMRKFIVVSENSPSPELKKQIANLESKNLYGSLSNSIRIQIFMYNELIFNPTKHFLVPKHRIMSEDEAKELLKYVRIEDLARLSDMDIQVRYLGAERLSILEILREDLNPYSDNIIHKSLFYRVVVNELL